MPDYGLNDYQKDALKTANYKPEDAAIYTALGLAGEAGEVANQVKKIIRDDGGDLTTERKDKIADELGDVLWYTATLAADIGVDLSEIAERNIRKLEMRSANGTISGDKRNE